MPPHLLFACLVYIASRGAMAVLTQFYEDGVARVTSPALMLLFIAVPILFMRRVRWTWHMLRWIAITEIALNALFFPNSRLHGAYAPLAQALIAAIMLASGVMLWSLLRRPETRRWFSRA
jgi:hypothetical protein